MARPIEAKPVLKGKDAEVFLAQMNAFSLRWLECGYGDDLPAALRDLADNLEREVGEEPADAKQGCRNIL
jgi:hypothetical protein